MFGRKEKKYIKNTNTLFEVSRPVKGAENSLSKQSSTSSVKRLKPLKSSKKPARIFLRRLGWFMFLGFFVSQMISIYLINKFLDF